MKEITIIARNEVGALAAVAEALGSVGVNIEAISAYATDNKAIFRVLTNDATSALKTLNRLPNITTKESDILLLRMINRPGELGKVTRKLANALINLESVYIVSKENSYTEVALKPANADFKKAKEILGIKD